MLPDTDIIVVGGGMAGFAAAMAAAQEGKKVTLVEKSNQLGGNATNSNVGTICGAYYRTLKETPTLVGYKFCKDFISELLSISDKNKLINYHNGLFVVSYEWSVLADYIEQQLTKAGVQILKNAEITGVKKDGDTISQLIIRNESQSIVLNPKNIIDCSGNGIVSQLAGLEMITSSSYQAASQVFRVKRIASDNEFSLNMALKKAMMQLVVTHQWSESFISLSIIPGSLKNNQADFKITLPDVITDDTELNKQLALKGKAYINEIFPQLTKEVDSLKNAEIELIFPEVGIRIQQRSMGKQVLTEEEVLSCNKPSDGITIGAWPIEEWGEDGKLNMQYFEANDGYMIPAGCLQSNGATNLYFAGKNISATAKAIGSARVIGTCLQTGYAAGKLATCNNETEKEKMILSLHKELIFGNG
jgi:hypothetical protein